MLKKFSIERFQFTYAETHFILVIEFQTFGGLKRKRKSGDFLVCRGTTARSEHPLRFGAEETRFFFVVLVEENTTTTTRNKTNKTEILGLVA